MKLRGLNVQNADLNTVPLVLGVLFIFGSIFYDNMFISKT